MANFSKADIAEGLSFLGQAGNTSLSSFVLKGRSKGGLIPFKKYISSHIVNIVVPRPDSDCGNNMTWLCKARIEKYFDYLLKELYSECYVSNDFDWYRASLSLGQHISKIRELMETGNIVLWKEEITFEDVLNYAKGA